MVDPLVFRRTGPEWKCHSPFGPVLVAPFGDGFGFWMAGTDPEDDPDGLYTTEGKALAAAQADFEARILGALIGGSE